jgi:hypothetical protein
MKRAILLIPLALAAIGSAHAQSTGPGTMNATGSTVVAGGNEFDWSVGEMTMVSTITSASIVVTQGVLQPADAGPSGVKNTSLLATQLQVFPNPATSLVNIQYSSQDAGTLTYKLTDMQSKVINTQTIKVAQGTTLEKVNVSELACATYMLEVTVISGNASPETISYKIQKLN